MKVIDIHGHIGNINIHPGWAGDAAMVHDIAVQSGISRVVVSSAMALQYDVEAGNREVMEAIDKYESLRGYAVVNPLLPSTLESLPEILGHPRMVGCKLHPDYHGYSTESPLFYRTVEKIAATAKVILCHVSCMPGTAFSTAESICRIAADFPDTKFILAHCAGIYQNGLYPYYPNYSGLEKMAGYGLPNVWADIAHYLVYVYPMVVPDIVGIAGADRLLFGTDMPLQGPLQCRFAVEAVMQADIGRVAKERILYRNALDIFGDDIAG
ncbi:MAG: amidohydrolase family protein [bacterium]|nr:amidohydrolase family protein [bacterium]